MLCPALLVLLCGLGGGGGDVGVGVEVTCSSFSPLPSDLALASLHSQLLKPAAIKSS